MERAVHPQVDPHDIADVAPAAGHVRAAGRRVAGGGVIGTARILGVAEHTGGVHVTDMQGVRLTQRAVLLHRGHAEGGPVGVRQRQPRLRDAGEHDHRGGPAGRRVIPVVAVRHVARRPTTAGVGAQVTPERVVAGRLTGPVEIHQHRCAGRTRHPGDAHGAAQADAARTTDRDRSELREHGRGIAPTGPGVVAVVGVRDVPGAVAAGAVGGELPAQSVVAGRLTGPVEPDLHRLARLRPTGNRDGRGLDHPGRAGDRRRDRRGGRPGADQLGHHHDHQQHGRTPLRHRSPLPDQLPCHQRR